MCDKFHLPVAAGLSDLTDLANFEAASLTGMADECGRWLSSTAESHADIVTPAAKTLWSVLVQGDVDHVNMTHRCLLAEIASRFSGEDEVA